MAARTLLIAGLSLLTAGCIDFAPHRLDGVSRAKNRPIRSATADPKGPPQTAAPLHIPGSPTAKAPTANEGVKPAAFVPTPAEPKPAAPEIAQAPTPQANPLRELHQKAVQRYATMDAYTMRLRRREVVNGKSRPEELMLVKFRREPWSVYFKWIGTEAKGREVVHVKGQHKNNIHTLTAAGDVPLLPAGQRFEVAPDSMLVRSKSRYPITQAGIESLIIRYGKLIDALDKGDTRKGTAKYLGKLKRPEFENWVEGVLQTVPPGSDPLLPRGGQRWWFFDTTLHLPALVITQDETSREVEYYCHDHFQFPVRLTDDDFNPNKLWKQAR